MIGRLFKKILGSRNDREIKRYRNWVKKINQLENWASALKLEEFPVQTYKFRERLDKGETLEDILPEAFAVVREAAQRTLGERHYDVQLMGAMVLHEGKISEMRTGEGKTLSSVPAAYLNALKGKGVHMVTVNDYLAERDAKWMLPVYRYLGMNVGVVLPGMNEAQRKEAYECDITYITNNELGFDYLRDNMVWDIRQKSQRELNYCIIDEIDSVLIDEARTPLIISGLAEGTTEIYYQAALVAALLRECEKDPQTGRYPDENLKGDFKIDEKGKRILLSEEGISHTEEILKTKGIIEGSLYLPKNLEYLHHVTQAIRARYLYQLDREYVIRDKKVEIVDEFTGRILEGRRYSEGLHQAIEVKENLPVARANRTLASITFQNFFRMYNKISGMTGTADTESKEFHKIYGLEVIVIPTNRPIARKDENDIMYVTEERKLKAIAEEVKKSQERGQPVLVGTVSIEKSEKLSHLFKREGIRHEVLNAKNHHKEALIIAEAGRKASVTIATNMAGRGTDIKLGGSLEHRARLKLGSKHNSQDMVKAIEEERPHWQKDYEEVRDLGGLFIIGSERHESRRIDNQLRGRSGRQGDPGRSLFFVSLEDDLMRLFGGDKLRKLVSRFGVKEDEIFSGGIFSRTLENAQKKVEERNFEIRKHLLEYDDVVSQQRRFIYSQRNEILVDSHLLERIKGLIGGYVDILLEPFGRYKELSFEQKHALKDSFINIFPYYPALDEIFLDSHDIVTIRHNLKEKALINLEEKRDLIGDESFNFFIRGEYLRAIDTLWQAHLESLDALREAVYLRSYAQKNPLTEYKNEGFLLFESLLDNIRKTVLSRLLQVQMRFKEDTQISSQQQKQKAIHESMNISFQTKSSLQDKSLTLKPIKADKVGRNDICPCGSGKKYKHCHGKE